MKTMQWVTIGCQRLGPSDFQKNCDAAELKIIHKRILTLTKSGYKQNMKVRKFKASSYIFLATSYNFLQNLLFFSLKNPNLVTSFKQRKIAMRICIFIFLRSKFLPRKKKSLPVGPLGREGVGFIVYSLHVRTKHASNTHSTHKGLVKSLWNIYETGRVFVQFLTKSLTNLYNQLPRTLPSTLADR